MALKSLPLAAWRNESADYRRRVIYISVPANLGHTIEDVQNPHYWWAHEKKINPGDILECVAADGSFEVWLRVTGKKDGKIATRVLLSFVDEALAASAQVEQDNPAKAPAPNKLGEQLDPPEGYRLKRGPGGRWQVIRKADGHVLHQGTPDYQASLEWARKHASADVAA
jgi:hypothetical protein